LLPLALLLGGLELGARRVGTLHHVRAVALERMQPAEIIVTGNSHETVGISCRELGRPCFKLAAGSQSVLYDRALLTKYGSRFPRAKVLLLGISCYSFKYAMQFDEGWREYEYLHAYGFDGERRALPWTDVRRYSVTMTYGTKTTLDWALRGFPPRLPAALADEQGDVDASAFVQREKSPAALARRLAQHERRLRPELVAETRAAVTAMVDWALARRVVPVLVVSPVTRGYARGTNAQEVAAMRAELSRLAQTRGALVADYLDDPRFSDDEFYDFDHLNRSGAQHFTGILRTEIIERASFAALPKRRE